MNGDGRLSLPPIAEKKEGREPGSLTLRPYEPNTHPPFWFLCRQLHLRYLDLEAMALFLSRRRPRPSIRISLRWHAQGCIPAGICTLDRRNSSKPRIKNLGACSDALIATAGYFTLFLCGMGTTVRSADDNKHKRAVCRNTLVTLVSEALPKNSSMGSSETLSERQHLETLWDN